MKKFLLVKIVFRVLSFISVAIFCCSCEDESWGCSSSDPYLGYSIPSAITSSGATLGGNVANGGSYLVTERGVVYSRFDDNSFPKRGGPGCTYVKDEEGGLGDFAVDVTGLDPGTHYIYRAYAFGEGGNIRDGEGYSQFVEFTTLPGVAGGETFEVDGSEIRALAVQADGKILVGGKFTSIAGEEALNLARLYPDGSFDPSFNADIDYPGFGGGRVNAIAVQPDGMIIIGGYFDHINGEGSSTVNVSIARLDPNGDRDPSFRATTGYGTVRCIAIERDGSVLVGGDLESVNGSAKFPCLVRLFDDGTIHPAFNAGPPTSTGPNGWVNSILVQEDGQIIIAGEFTAYNGLSTGGNLARLTSAGYHDNTFIMDPLVGFADCLALQTDGKILFGGRLWAFPSPPALFRVDGSTGVLDPTFATSSGTGAFTNDAINTVAVQADGKILIGGSFTQVQGTPFAGIARVHENGLLDTSFLASPSLDGSVAGVALGLDGTVFACSHLGGVVTENAKLLGAFDNDPAPSSLTGLGSVNWVRNGAAPEISSVTFEYSINGGGTWTDLGAVERIPGGGGWWIETPALSGNGLLRARGRTMGGSYGGSTGLVEQIEDFPIPGVSQPSVANPTHEDVDGDYALLGGEITNVGASPIIERGVLYSRAIDNDEPALNAYGVKKESVFEEEGVDITAGTFAVDVFDLIGGVTYRYRAYAINAAGRISYSGIGTFKTIGAPTVNSPTDIGITHNGATLGGNIISNGGHRIIERGVYVIADVAFEDERLGDNDTDYLEFIDPTPIAEEEDEADIGTGLFTVTATGLTPGTGYFFAAYAINSEGTVYSEDGYFTTLADPEISEEEGASPSYLSAVEASAPAGQIDSSFDVGGGLGAIDGIVQAIAVLPGGLGDILVAGGFNNVGGESHRGIARLDESGAVYPEFDTRTDGVVNSVAVGSDGSIVIGGIFTIVNGTLRNGIAKLDADGDNVIPTEFDPGAGADNVVYSVAVQEDGKILVGGLFGTVQGQVRSRIARLHANGSLDTGFNPGADDAVYSLAVQPDGKILVAGNFTHIAGTAVNRIARLNADGTLDATFDPGSGANGRVAALALQPDGKVLLGGYFTQVDGSDHVRIARLEVDGSLDPTFATGAGANDKVFTMALQTDGKILIGGLFTNFNGSNLNRIARLNANGSLDANFDAGNGADAEVSAIALQTDGSILIGGDFLTFDGVDTANLLRYGNDAAVENLTVIDGTQLLWTRSGSGPAIQPLGFEVSTDSGVTWSDLGDGVPVTGGRSLAGQNLPLAGMVRALGQSTGGFLGGSTGLVEEIAVFDHGAIVTGLRAKLAVANANVVKLRKQIKAAKKKKNAAKAKKLTKSLKTAMAQIPKINADLAKY